MNIGASWPTPEQAEARVLEIQAKLHRWASADPARRFNDVFNLVCDPAFLLVGWRRVRGNKGSRTAGVDGMTAYHVTAVRGEEPFLTELRTAVKARTFRPLPVRERLIPKKDGKRRRLGIPALRDRVVQAALKLVLEPIFEADFQPSSYGFRPNRRAHDAMAEIHMFATQGYVWVLDADIEACFDSIDHTALMHRVRRRIGDRRVLALVKAFLKTGVLTEQGQHEDSGTGTPQGGILSPLLANIALSPLDELFAEKWSAVGTRSRREKHRRKGHATYKIVRYADDFVVLVNGQQAHAEALRTEVEHVLGPLGLRLSATKTRVAHVDEGFDFLGFRVRRHRQRGSQRRYIYIYPSRNALATVKAKVRMRMLTRRPTTSLALSSLLYRLNFVVRGWAYYFRHSACSRTFAYLNAFTWRRVARWLRKKHPRASWKDLRRRYFTGWIPGEHGVELFYPTKVRFVPYRYRGARIPTPWTA